jgi:hypothetical protein
MARVLLCSAVLYDALSYASHVQLLPHKQTAKRAPVFEVVMCHNAYAYPELQWHVANDSVHRATLTVGVSNYTNDHGTFTTRAFDNMRFPGPSCAWRYV